jgi:HAD superfamily hydrolase (TIGR01549 family)
MNKAGNLIKAVIFDIDGTLIDSNDAHAESFVAAFKEFGKIVPFVEMKWLIGMGADMILEKYLTKKEIEKFGEDLTEYRKKIFLREFFPKLKTFPKMRRLLEKINRDGKKIALASSASDDELEKYHGLLKIDDLLDKETSSDDAEESKPAPDIFQAALGKLKDIKKTEALVIGDTPYDAEAARRADLKIIGVKSGGWSRERLIEKGCLEVYENVGEIFENYEQIFSNEKFIQ